MQDKRMSGVDSMEERLMRALERKPAVDVAAGFAERVAGQVPTRREVAVPAAGYGLLAAWIGLGVLLLALVAVAMRSTGPTVFEVALEWILCAELAGLALWLGGMWKPMES
jgi:hydroxyethylthiazole kinase-like sugar kinase family protein